MDLHQKEIQGFFSFPVDNLRASPFLIQYIQEEVIVLLCMSLNIGAATSKSYQSIYPMGTQVLYSVFLPSCQIPDYRNAIIVAKSPSAAKRWVMD